MSSLDQAAQTQLTNIQTKTGKSLSELAAFAKNSGLSKHGELRDYFKERFGLGHGDANALVHEILKSAGAHEAAGKNDNEIYSGPKAAFRTIADLANSTEIQSAHLAEALQYRPKLMLN